MRLPKRLQLVSPSHARAKVQEKATAKRLGGRVTKGSGNGLEKADVRLRGVVRVECKTTKHGSFSVTAEHLRKLEQAVFGAGEVPVMQVEITGGRFLVLPDWALDLLLERGDF